MHVMLKLPILIRTRPHHVYPPCRPYFSQLPKQLTELSLHRCKLLPAQNLKSHIRPQPTQPPPHHPGSHQILQRLQRSSSQLQQQQRRRAGQQSCAHVTVHVSDAREKRAQGKENGTRIRQICGRSEIQKKLCQQKEGETRLVA